MSDFVNNIPMEVINQKITILNMATARTIAALKRSQGKIDIDQLMKTQLKKAQKISQQIQQANTVFNQGVDSDTKPYIKTAITRLQSGWQNQIIAVLKSAPPMETIYQQISAMRRAAKHMDTVNQLFKGNDNYQPTVDDMLNIVHQYQMAHNFKLPQSMVIGLLVESINFHAEDYRHNTVCERLIQLNNYIAKNITPKNRNANFIKKLLGDNQLNQQASQFLTGLQQDLSSENSSAKQLDYTKYTSNC